MWLLKLHFSISVLCLITFKGFMSVCRDTVKDNGWIDENQKKQRGVLKYFIFFVPIMNIFVVLIGFMMMTVKKKDFDKLCEDEKKENDSRKLN